MAGGEKRYGVFLRPDPETCWVVTQITFALKRQFGLVSAGAFPPHVTLLGNLATEASTTGLLTVLDRVFEDVPVFEVFNGGVARTGDRFGYDVDRDAEGAVNAPLAEVAAAAQRAVLPLSEPIEDFLVTPVEDYRFAAHLSLAGHELAVDGTLADEVGEFIAGLPLVPPASFPARWYSLFEFRADWRSHWWRAMTWRHLRSWRAREL
jgi:hypothetical protein